MVESFANSGDPDHMPHSAESDLGLHCLPITLLEVSRLQWVKALDSEKSFFPQPFLWFLCIVLWLSLFANRNKRVYIYDETVTSN